MTGVLSIPFTLDNGTVVRVEIPTTITLADIERLATFLAGLVDELGKAEPSIDGSLS